MNKLQFLRELNKELGALSPEERKEIIDFYEERFHSGRVYENKTDEQIIMDLETPKVIARNVLEEYGINPRYITTEQERYSGIKGSHVFWLIVFDLLIASWVIPTMFGLVVGFGGSFVSYVAMFALLVDPQFPVDINVFWAITGVYILIGLIFFVIIDLSLLVTRKIVMMHLNVFKVNGRTNFNKKLSNFTLDRWFKKHRLLNTIKTFSFFVAFGLIIVNSYQIFLADGNIFDSYSNQALQEEVYTYDVTNDITEETLWDIYATVNDMNVTIVKTSGTDIVVTYQYLESNKDEEFMYSFNDQKIAVTQKNEFWHFFSFHDVLGFLKPHEEVIIEVPEGLYLQLISISGSYSEVKLNDIIVDEISIDVSSGRVELEDLSAQNISIDMMSGDVVVKSIGTEHFISTTHSLEIDNVSGLIRVDNIAYTTYILNNVSGTIDVSNLNTLAKDGVELNIDNVSGNIYLEEVYVAEVNADNISGNIEYYNDEVMSIDFNPDTVSGSISDNIN